MDTGDYDPFTSSREGVIEDDKKFALLLEYLQKGALPTVIDDWDKLRLKHGEEGDEENIRKSKKQRKARDLYSAAKEEFEPEDDAPKKDQVESWLNALRDDAEYNLSAYIDCFLSENLIRQYIRTYNPEISTEAGKRN